METTGMSSTADTLFLVRHEERNAEERMQRRSNATVFVN